MSETEFESPHAWLKACLASEPDRSFTKPCHDTGFCPYGQLVEEFPIPKKRDHQLSCEIFGHHCPVFYCGGTLCEETT